MNLRIVAKRNSGDFSQSGSGDVRDGSERLYPTPTSATDNKHKSAPDLTDRGRLRFLERETGLEPATLSLGM